MVLPGGRCECLIRVGRALRIVEEDGEPYAVVEHWWPIANPEKHGQRANIFGTWIPCAKPVVKNAGGALAKKRKTVNGVSQHTIVKLLDVLVWPLDLERCETWPEGGKIPFSAMDYLRNHCHADLAQTQFIFTKRGKQYFLKRVKSSAKAHLESMQQGS
jgi:hypothetical protein